MGSHELCTTSAAQGQRVCGSSCRAARHFLWTDTPAARHIFTCTVIAQYRRHACLAPVVKFELRSQNTHFVHALWLTHLLLHATLSTSSRSLSSTSLVLFSSTSPTPGLLSTHPSIHCGDPRQDGTSAEYQLLTGDEPKRVELNRTLFNLSNQEIDDQDDIEETDFKPMSFSQSLIHSAYDSAESIATPPDSDLEDEQLRMVLASPLKTEVSVKPDAECVQKREANAQRVQAYHSRRESLTSSSSRDLEASGHLVTVFSCHSESSQNTFSERERSNEPGNRFESGVHSVLRIAGPAKVAKSLLGGNKDHLLNQARSERMKQEHQVGSLNYCIDELHKTNKLMLQDWNGGRPSLMRWISTRTSSTTRRTSCEGKSSSRQLDSKYARDGRDEESSRTTSWITLCTKN